MTAIDLLVTEDFLYPMNEGCPILRDDVVVAHRTSGPRCGLGTGSTIVFTAVRIQAPSAAAEAESWVVSPGSARPETGI